MIVFNKIPERLILNSQKRSKLIGNIPNSYKKGEHSAHGIMAETLWHKMYPECTRVNDYDKDFVSPHGTRIEVKSRIINTPPKADFNCGVFAYTRRQAYDIAVFFYVKKDFSKAWFMGYTDKESILKSKFYKEGESDPKGFKFPKASYCLGVTNLKDLCPNEIKNWQSISQDYHAKYVDLQKM